MGESYDTIQKGQIQTYSFQVDNPETDFKVKLEVFSGNPDLYVSPLNIPERVYESAFNSKDHFFNEELIITPQQRQEQNALQGLYFLIVYAQSDCSFKISVSNENRTQFLTEGLSQSNYLLSNQIDNYFFRDSSFGSPWTHLIFQFHLIYGQAQYFVKVCKIHFENTEEEILQICSYKQTELTELANPNLKSPHISQIEKNIDQENCRVRFQFEKPMISTCIYVIGVISLSPNKTHYSIIVKTQQPVEFKMFKEGHPVRIQTQVNIPDYYQFKVTSNETKKVVIQLTSLTGDSNLYASFKEKPLSFDKFKEKSLQAGQREDLIEYIVNPKNPERLSLVGDFYVVVFSDEQSTCTLTFFTEVENRNQIPIKLYSGQLQKNQLQGPKQSYLYYIEVSTLKQDNIEVMLNSQQQMKMLIGYDRIPTQYSFDQKGDSMKSAKIQIIQNQSALKAIFYILVMTNNVDPTFYNTYTILYQDDNTWIELIYDYQLKTIIDKESSQLFFFDYEEFNSKEDFIVYVDVFSGALDVIINFNQTHPNLGLNQIAENKDKLDNQLQVLSHFEVLGGEGIIQEINQAVIKNWELMNNQSFKKVYISIINRHSLASLFEIQFGSKDYTKKQLQIGSIRTLKLNDRTQSEHFIVDLRAIGNLMFLIVLRTENVQLNCLFEFYIPKEYKNSNEDDVFNTISTLIDSNQTYEITQDQYDPFHTCAQSPCYLHLTITGEFNDDSHFKGRVIDYMLELLRSFQDINDSVNMERSIIDNDSIDKLKYYKTEPNTDLEINIHPNQLNSKITLTVTFYFDLNSSLQNREQKTNKSYDDSEVWTQLVTNPFNLKIKGDSIIRNNRVIPSNGYFYIQIKSPQSISYSIQVSQQLSDQNIKRVHIGQPYLESIKPISINYYYFKNIFNSTLQLSYEIRTRQITQQMNKQFLRVNVGTSNRFIHSTDIQSMKYQWSFMNDAGRKIMFDQIKIKTVDPDYCADCYYLIQVQNLFECNDLYFELLINQDSNENKGYKSQIIVGAPRLIKLNLDEQINLKFQTKQLQKDITLSIQYYTGVAQIQLSNTSLVLFTYPHAFGINADQLVVNSRVNQNEHQLKFLLESDQSSNNFELQLTSIDNDLFCSILITDQNQLLPIQDGILQSIYFDSNYTQDNKSTQTQSGNTEVQSEDIELFYSYIPPADKFQLSVYCQPSLINLNYSISMKQVVSQEIQFGFKDEGGQLRYLFDKEDERNQIFKKSIVTNQELQQNSTQKNQYTNLTYRQQLNKIIDYDYTLKSSPARDLNGVIYETFHFEMKNQNDMILVRILGQSNKKQEYIKLSLSASDIQYLQLGQTMKGHVSNWNQTFKIYEIFISKAHLRQNQSQDLLIELQPCNGRVDLFISSNLSQLFDNQISLNQTQNLILNSSQYHQPLDFNHLFRVESSLQFGQIYSQVKQIQNYPYDTIYLGVQSTNEFYSDIKDQQDSFYHIKASIVNSSQQGIYQKYQIQGSKNHRQFQIKEDLSDEKSFTLKWEPVVYHLDSLENNDNQNITIPQSHFEPVQNVTYHIYATTDPKGHLDMISLCSIKHTKNKNIFKLLQTQEGLENNQIKLLKEDIQVVKAIGLIAQFKDNQTGEIISFTYDPFLFENVKFGINMNTIQMTLIITFLTLLLLVFCLIIYCLKKQYKRFLERLNFQKQIVNNEMEFNDKLEYTIDSKESIDSQTNF
eukprot:403355617